MVWGTVLSLQLLPRSQTNSLTPHCLHNYQPRHSPLHSIHSFLISQALAVSLQKLWGSLTLVASGAFVDSCQLGQPLLALVVFSVLHSAPSMPQVLLRGTGRLCRLLSTRPAPLGAGRFFCNPQGPCLPLTLDILYTLLMHPDYSVEGDSSRIVL